ncbi:MAG: protein-export chaperone SecB [Fibrobacter sp.]|nr:protein-export chaperone SecB [Fibrobacter sp.]
MINFSLANWVVNRLTINRKREGVPSPGRYNLDIKSAFEERKFYTNFVLTLDNREYDMEIEVVFTFVVNEGTIDEDFRKSSFPRVNAPAIAYPYLRSMVSNITLQSGFEPAILPTINFSALDKEKQD